jgi:1,5-anhydro-D-fructose reductase (1,5-anhydro-D-mannitol-forming)
MAIVRWGIIGCGDVAEKKGGPALYQAESSELIAVMRRDRAKAEDFARRHGAKRAYDTVETLLADPEIDAVYIATPPHLHCPQTLQAAAAGKSVLVEKPMALNTAECEQMIAACSAAGVSLHVAYYRRYWPKFQAIKAVLEAGELGTTLGARLQLCTQAAGSGWRVDPAISGGGHVVDVGSHRLDMLLFLLGEVVETQGFAANRLGHHSAENDSVFALRFASGALASASFHFHTSPSRDVLEIFGSQGTLVCDSFDSIAFTIKGKEHRFETPSPTHLPFVQALVQGKPSHVTGEEGKKVTQILEKVLRE